MPSGRPAAPTATCWLLARRCAMVQQPVLALILTAPRPPASTCCSHRRRATAPMQQATVLKPRCSVPGGGNSCLDGSPFGYYIARNSSSRDWVIVIAGGGGVHLRTCVQRMDGASRWHRRVAGGRRTRAVASPPPPRKTTRISPVSTACFSPVALAPSS